MNSLPIVASILMPLAVIFLALALQQHLAAEGKLTPAVKTWLRISIIFSAVSIALAVLPAFFA